MAIDWILLMTCSVVFAYVLIQRAALHLSAANERYWIRASPPSVQLLMRIYHRPLVFYFWRAPFRPESHASFKDANPMQMSIYGAATKRSTFVGVPAADRKRENDDNQQFARCRCAAP